MRATRIKEQPMSTTPSDATGTEPQPDHEDRRRSVRQALEGTIRGHLVNVEGVVESTFVGRGNDESAGGIALICETSLPAHSFAWIEISHGDGSRAFMFGHMTHCLEQDDGQYHIGFEFRRPPAGVKSPAA
jgi:hypothetical protein